MANQDLEQYYRRAFQDFGGGLATRSNALVIPANKFAQLDNCIINDTDILEKAPGYILDGSPFANTAASFIRMLVNFRVGESINTLVCAAQDSSNTNATYKVDLKQSSGDGTYHYIGHNTGTALFTQTSATVTGLSTLWSKHLKAGDKIGTGSLPTVWYEIQSVNSDTSITLTAVYSEATTASVSYMARIILNYANYPSGMVFNNNLIVCNGSETPMAFDNTTVSKLQSANVQAFQFVCKHKNRMFGAKWPSSPSGLLWSAANDHTTIDATSRTTIFSQDNGQTVGMISYAGSLLIFKDNGLIYQVVGEFDQSAAGQPANIRKIDVPDNIGVIAGQSICILEDNNTQNGYQQLGSRVYFLSETGVYSINSWMQVNKVSWDIEPTVRGLQLKSTATANKSYPFTSKAQWDTGTTSGLSDLRVTNGISTYFDTLSISSAKQTNGGCASVIDSGNDVHTAYISSDGLSVMYNRWEADDNTSTTATVIAAITTTTVVETNGAAISTATWTGPDCVSIAVASNGTVGVISKYKVPDTSYPLSTFYPWNGTATYVFSEYTAGAWTHTRIYSTPVETFVDAYYGTINISMGYNSASTGMYITYNASNDPRFLLLNAKGHDSASPNNRYHGTGAAWVKRILGVWTNVDFDTSTTAYLGCSVIFQSNGTVHGAMTYTGGISYFKSTDESTFTQTTIALSSLEIGSGGVSVGLNNLNQAIIAYNLTGGSGTDIGKIARYNVTTAATSYIDTASTNYLRGYSNQSGLAESYYSYKGGYEKFIFDTNYSTGTAQFINGNTAVAGTGTNWSSWVAAGDTIRIQTDAEAVAGTVLTVNSDTSITLTAVYAGTSTTAAYIAKSRKTVTNTTASLLNTTYRTNSSSLQESSGVVLAVAFGANASEIRVRRVTLFGKWTSPTESDSSLTSWSTYDVGTPVTNGNLIVYEVGLSTSSPIAAALVTEIVPGSVISTDATKIYTNAILTFVLQSFASSSVQSLTMNYVGTGADGKYPNAFVFNNEMYLSVAASGDSNNSEILFLDRKAAWGLWTPDVTCFTRYNQQLYAGSATNGNIYKLRNGYAHSSSAYSMTAITKEDLLGSLELQKDIYKVYVVYKVQSSGTFNFSYRLDNFKTSGGSTWVSTSIDQTKDGLAEVPLQTPTATSIQFKISQDDANVQVGVIGFIVLYGYLNVR